MRATPLLVLAALALVGATGLAAAAPGPTDAPIAAASQSKPPMPGGSAPGDGANNTTTVAPGQRLAGAVGAQGASLQGDLWNRTLTDRLANATTADERAAVIVDETDALSVALDDLESVRANLTGAWKAGTLSEGQYRASLSAFVVRARSVERRANQTARAAERLPFGVRYDSDVNVTHIREISRDARALYRFDGPVARSVVNETLSARTAAPAFAATEAAAGDDRSTPDRPL